MCLGIKYSVVSLYPFQSLQCYVSFQQQVVDAVSFISHFIFFGVSTILFFFFKSRHKPSFHGFLPGYFLRKVCTPCTFMPITRRLSQSTPRDLPTMILGASTLAEGQLELPNVTIGQLTGNVCKCEKKKNVLRYGVGH